jgi:hypothetical protein
MQALIAQDIQSRPLKRQVHLIVPEAEARIRGSDKELGRSNSKVSEKELGPRAGKSGS